MYSTRTILYVGTGSRIELDFRDCILLRFLVPLSKALQLELVAMDILGRRRRCLSPPKASEVRDCLTEVLPMFSILKWLLPYVRVLEL